MNKIFSDPVPIKNIEIPIVKKPGYKDLSITKNLTPEDSFIGFDIPNVRFTRENLIDEINSFKNTINRTPIEVYEIELFKAAALYYESFQGLEITIKCVEKIHHIHNLSQENYRLNLNHQTGLKKKIDSLITASPLILSEYNLFKKLLEICNCLLIK